MPARLHFSNSLEVLADRLIAGLRGGDPFDAPCIATPSPALRGWLQCRWAETMGIAVNLDFQNLESLLWDLLAQRDRFRSDATRLPAQLLDGPNFQGLLMAALRRDPPEPLREYLTPTAATDPYDAARRLCQLSGRLASLFREYEYSRVGEHGFPALTTAWKRGTLCFEPYWRLRALPAAQQDAARAMEQWQRGIYQALFREGGWRDRWGERSGIYRYTLPQYAEMVLHQSGRNGTGVSPRCHLFGLSHISPFHRALIRQLGDPALFGAAAVRFEIYALNPCAEFWEDALTPREQRARSRIREGRGKFTGWTEAALQDRLAARFTEDELRTEELPDPETENALLSRFGKPGRETIQLWNQITDYDFCGYFRAPEGDTLLAALQRAVLQRRGPLPSEERMAQDASLQIWSAPDAYAEAEAVRAHLAERLLADPELRPEDVAVLIPDADAYAPVLEAVFTAQAPQQAGYVPHCLLEAAPGENLLIGAFRMLLELAAGPFRPGPLRTWMETPPVQRALGPGSGGGGGAAAFATFWERAGFREGWDVDHMRQQGRPAGPSTWEAARGRLLAGLILDGVDPAVAETDWAPVGEAATAWDRDDLAACLDWMENLRRDLLPFRSEQPLAFAEWGRRLTVLLDRYFRIDPKETQERRGETILRRFFSDLEAWNGLDGLKEGVDGDAETVPHHVISVLFQDRFSNAAGRLPRSPFLAGGVRIGSVAALRGLPFRHFYMLGLTAGDFPTPADPSPLDLRGLRRIPGETDPAARDLYAFLECLGSTRERLVLSYVSQDASRDSLRQPSYALTGLMAYLESDLLPAGAPFTLLALDAEGRPAADPKPIWADPAPRRELEPLRLQAASAIDFDPAWTRTWAEPPALPHETAFGKDAAVLDLRDLAAYLKNPAEHACFRCFGLSADFDADQEEEGPALEYGKWETGRLLAETLRAELGAPGSGENHLRRLLRRRHLQGTAPPPPFSELESERLAACGTRMFARAASLQDALKTLGLRFAGTLRLGRGARPLDPPITALSAFSAAGLGVALEIGGTLPGFFSGDRPGGAWALLLSGSEAQTPLMTYLLQLCLAALGGSGHALLSGPCFVVEFDILSDSKRPGIYRLPALAPESAARQLRTFLADIRRAPDFDLLSLDAVRKIAEQTPDTPPAGISAWKAKLEEQERELRQPGFFAPYERSRLLRAVDPEIPDDAEDKIQRRLLPFLLWRAQWEAWPPAKAEAEVDS